MMWIGGCGNCGLRHAVAVHQTTIQQPHHGKMTDSVMSVMTITDSMSVMTIYQIAMYQR